ncbi:MAG: MFS transporter, partial [Candidatus Dormibacteria bacterium]
YTLPGVVASLGLGHLLSRWDARFLILSDASLRMVSLALVAAAALIGILTPGWYVTLLGISSLLGLLAVTGELTSVSELLPASQQVAGNSLLTFASFGAVIIGPAVAGVVITVTGPGVVIAADAATYLVLVVAVVVSRRLEPPPPASVAARLSMLRALRQLGRHPAILGISLLCVAFFGLYGPVEVALPVYVAKTLHSGAAVLGGYWTVFAIGATLGSLSAAWVERFGTWRVALLVMVGWGACLIPFGFTDTVIIGFVALGFGGLVYGPFLPLKRTIIQRASPPSALASLAAASALLTVPASPVGTALGGPLVAAIGAPATLLTSGLATVAAAVVGALVLRPQLRRRARAL